MKKNINVDLHLNNVSDSQTFNPGDQVLVKDVNDANKIKGVDASQIANPNQLDFLVEVTEGANTGRGSKFRLQNPDNYGDIGNGAVDLSFSNQASTTNGATGDNSFAVGPNAKAAGDGSDAIGSNSETFSNNEVNIGPFPFPYTPAGNNGDRAFNISTGTDDINRRNSLTILKDGKVGVGFDDFESTNFGNNFEVNGTAFFNDVAFSNATQQQIVNADDEAIVNKNFFQKQLFNYDNTSGDFGVLGYTITSATLEFTTFGGGAFCVFSMRILGVNGTNNTLPFNIRIFSSDMPLLQSINNSSFLAKVSAQNFDPDYVSLSLIATDEAEFEIVHKSSIASNTDFESFNAATLTNANIFISGTYFI